MAIYKTEKNLGDGWENAVKVLMLNPHGRNHQSNSYIFHLAFADLGWSKKCSTKFYPNPSPFFTQILTLSSPSPLFHPYLYFTFSQISPSPYFTLTLISSSSSFHPPYFTLTLISSSPLFHPHPYFSFIFSSI